MKIKRFIVTDEHVKLLQRMYVGWNNAEFGAPEIDPKRPYGNWDADNDLAEIIGVHDPQHKKNAKRLRQLHRETETVLSIFLRHGILETGTFVADEYDQNWRKV